MEISILIKPTRYKALCRWLNKIESFPLNQLSQISLHKKSIYFHGRRRVLVVIIVSSCLRIGLRFLWYGKRRLIKFMLSLLIFLFSYILYAITPFHVLLSLSDGINTIKHFIFLLVLHLNFPLVFLLFNFFFSWYQQKSTLIDSFFPRLWRRIKTFKHRQIDVKKTTKERKKGKSLNFNNTVSAQMLNQPHNTRRI